MPIAIAGQGGEDFLAGSLGAVSASCPYSGTYTSVVNVTGSGMLKAVQCTNNSPRLRLIIDGVTMIDEDGDFGTLTTMMVKFKTSLQVLGRAANSAGPAACYAFWSLD